MRGNSSFHDLPLAVKALHTQVDLVLQVRVANQKLHGILVEELAARRFLQKLLMVCLHAENTRTRLSIIVKIWYVSRQLLVLNTEQLL
jgi:hypothetical protein